jgi:hypothetical protein
VRLDLEPGDIAVWPLAEVSVDAGDGESQLRR